MTRRKDTGDMLYGDHSSQQRQGYQRGDKELQHGTMIPECLSGGKNRRLSSRVGYESDTI